MNKKSKQLILGFCFILLGACSDESVTPADSLLCEDADADGSYVLSKNQNVGFSMSQNGFSGATTDVASFSCSLSDLENLDCDDTNANINPRVSEDLEGLVDLNCNGTANGSESIPSHSTGTATDSTADVTDTDLADVTDQIQNESDGDFIEGSTETSGTELGNEGETNTADSGEIEGEEVIHDVDGLDRPEQEESVGCVSSSSLDSDADGTVNDCDADDDGDGVDDANDNCELIANADQLDSDHDSSGDACDFSLDLEIKQPDVNVVLPQSQPQSRFPKAGPILQPTGVQHKIPKETLNKPY